MKTLLAVILLAIAASTAAAQSETYKSRAAADIRRVMDEQAAAWNRGDIPGFMIGYWNSDKLVFVGAGGVTRGWQPTLDRYRKSYDSRAKMGMLTFSELEIDVISKDAAVVAGKWSLTREKDNPNGMFTLVFRKLKDGWRIVRDHTS